MQVPPTLGPAARRGLARTVGLMSAYGSGGLVSGYTGLKVHRPLAALLDVLAAPEGLEEQQCDRFSNETGGLLGEVQRHCSSADDETVTGTGGPSERELKLVRPAEPGESTRPAICW